METQNEITKISAKIEANTATLEDYNNYEKLLLNSGLTHDYIFSYLRKAGFNSWNDFIKARQKKEKDKENEAVVVGGLLGIGLGILLLSAFSNSK